MAGHSHWSSIKHKKAAADARRGRLFSKLAKNIMVAARSGGDPLDNLKLRYAIERARAEFMPKDAIERAIKKGTGELGGGELQEITYEGIGPGGVSIIVEAVTDNRNRTSGEIRNLLEKRGGSLGKTGSVTWKFDHLGILELSEDALPEDILFEVVTEAGAEDIEREDGVHRITTSLESLETVRAAVQRAVDERSPRKERAWGAEEDTAPLFTRHEIAWIPQNPIPLDDEKSESVLEVLSLLDDHDDVQNVYCDVELSEQAGD